MFYYDRKTGITIRRVTMIAVILLFILGARGNTWIDGEDVRYYVSSEPATYREAVRQCEEINGSLTNLVGDLPLVPFIEEMEDEVPYYIGIFLDKNDKIYKWQDSNLKVDDTIVSYIKGQRGRCVLLKYNKRSEDKEKGKLTKTGCYQKHRYICRSYKQCLRIHVKGFEYQIQYNGYYNEHESNNEVSVNCDKTQRLYAKIEQSQWIYICKNKRYDSFLFYNDTSHKAGLQTDKGRTTDNLHRMNNPVDVYESNMAGKWVHSEITLSCIHYENSVIPTEPIHKSTIYKETSSTTNTATRTNLHTTQRTNPNTQYQFENIDLYTLQSGIQSEHAPSSTTHELTASMPTGLDTTKRTTPNAAYIFKDTDNYTLPSGIPSDEAPSFTTYDETAPTTNEPDRTQRETQYTVNETKIFDVYTSLSDHLVESTPTSTPINDETISVSTKQETTQRKTAIHLASPDDSSSPSGFQSETIPSSTTSKLTKSKTTRLESTQRTTPNTADQSEVMKDYTSSAGIESETIHSSAWNTQTKSKPTSPDTERQISIKRYGVTVDAPTNTTERYSVSDRVLVYMNIIIWLLVCVFVFVDLGLLLKYRSMRRDQ